MSQDISTDNNDSEPENQGWPKPIVDAIQKVEPNLIQGLSEDEKVNLDNKIAEEIKNTYSQKVQIKSVSEMYQGPIPPPEILRGIEEVIPGGAERVLVMAEKQSDHRMFIEKRRSRFPFIIKIT